MPIDTRHDQTRGRVALVPRDSPAMGGKRRRHSTIRMRALTTVQPLNRAADPPAASPEGATNGRPLARHCGRGGCPLFCVGGFVQLVRRPPKWILKASRTVVQFRVRVQAETAFWMGRTSSLRAASSEGKWPLVLTASRSWRLRASIALVVGMKGARCRCLPRHAGRLLPNARSCCWPTGSTERHVPAGWSSVK
jgi:hypothetical protein